MKWVPDIVARYNGINNEKMKDVEWTCIKDRSQYSLSNISRERHLICKKKVEKLRRGSVNVSKM